MGRLQARPALHHYVRALGHSGIVIPDFSDIYGVNLVNDWDAVNKVLNGGDVSRVTDAQANDDIDQSNASRQPLWEAAGGPGPNGAPSIAHTVANSDALANTAYTSLGADVPYTVYLVFKHTAWAAFQQYLMLEDSAGGDTLRFRARTGADRYEITFNNAVSTSTIAGANDVGNWHVARLTYNDAGQLAGVRLDNAAEVTVATGAFSEAIGRFHIGGATQHGAITWTRCLVIDRLATAGEDTDTAAKFNRLYGNGGGASNIPTLTW